MVRRSQRPRRRLPGRCVGLVRTVGWRYSVHWDAYVHRAFGGRYGPVFVVGPDHEFPIMDSLDDVHALLMYDTPFLRGPILSPLRAAPSAVAAIYPEDPWAGMRVDGAPPSLSVILANRLRPADQVVGTTLDVTAGRSSAGVARNTERDRTQRLVSEA